MIPLTTRSRTSEANACACSYVSRGMGAIPLGRWHTTQWLYKIGATFLVKVRGVSATAVACREHPEATTLRHSASRTKTNIPKNVCRVKP